MDIKNLNKDRIQRRKNKPIDQSSMMYGKIPPQAKNLEEAVIGAILLEKEAYNLAVEILKPECFYVEAHQIIFSAMMGLAQKSSPVDSLTVYQELLFREQLDLIGGPHYLTKLTQDVVSAANIVAHSQIIMQKFLQRELIRIGGEIVGDAYEDSADAFDLLNDAEVKIFSITSEYIQRDYKSLDQGLVEVVKRIEHLRALDTSLTGVPSGYKELDKITHGWQAKDFIILAARPSVGKTAFALNLARNAVKNEEKPTAVGFFSLEMSIGQLTQRILSAESEIRLEQIKTGRLDDMQMKVLYEKGVQRLATKPVYIDDSATLTLFEFKAKVRRMKTKHGVGLIIIDYLQLMTDDEARGSNREQFISKISREVKKTAKEMDIPIIALSQLSREVEKRAKGSKIPQLSDLRESGALEQDADLVAALYRPPEDEIRLDRDLAGKALLRILKNRDGSLEDIAFAVDNNIQAWTEQGVFNPFREDIVRSNGVAPAGGNYKPVFIPVDNDDLPF